MFGQMVKAIGVMIVGLIAVGWFFLSNAGSSAIASPSPDSLSRKDVFGSARLTASERASGVEVCNRRITEFSFATVRLKRTKKESELDKARRFCDCFANQVEDRSSRMQYAMAMTVLSKGYSIRDHARFPAFADYKAASRKHGMSGEDFDAMRRELGRSMIQSAEQCALNMMGG